MTFSLSVLRACAAAGGRGVHVLLLPPRITLSPPIKVRTISRKRTRSSNLPAASADAMTAG